MWRRDRKGVEISYNVLIAGLNSSVFSPPTIKKILISFVRPQMEYGLGSTSLGKGLESALDKAWNKIWRSALSLPPKSSRLAMLNK